MFFRKDKENWKFKYNELVIVFENMERELKRELELERFRNDGLIKSLHSSQAHCSREYNDIRARWMNESSEKGKFKDLYLSKCEECLNLREEIIRLRTEIVSKKEV